MSGKMRINKRGFVNAKFNSAKSPTEVYIKLVSQYWGKKKILQRLKGTLISLPASSLRPIPGLSFFKNRVLKAFKYHFVGKRKTKSNELWFKVWGSWYESPEPSGKEMGYLLIMASCGLCTLSSRAQFVVVHWGWKWRRKTRNDKRRRKRNLVLPICSHTDFSIVLNFTVCGKARRVFSWLLCKPLPYLGKPRWLFVMCYPQVLIS